MHRFFLIFSILFLSTIFARANEPSLEIKQLMFAPVNVDQLCFEVPDKDYRQVEGFRVWMWLGKQYKDVKTGCFQFNFNLDKVPERDLGLAVTRIVFAYEVYLNNKLIDQVGKIFETGLAAFYGSNYEANVIVLPRSHLKRGKNSVSFRVGSIRGIGGLLPGNITLEKVDTAFKRWAGARGSSAIYVTILLFLSISSFVQFLFRRQLKINLVFSIMTLCAAVMQQGTSGSVYSDYLRSISPYISGYVLLFIKEVFTFVMVAALLYIIPYMLGVRRPIYTLIALIYFCTTAVIILGLLINPYIGTPVLQLAFATAPFVCLSAIIMNLIGRRSFNLSGDSWFAKVHNWISPGEELITERWRHSFAAVMAALFIAGIFDYISRYISFTGGRIWLAQALILLFCFVGLMLSRQNARAHMIAEDLTKNLQKEIDIKSRQFKDVTARISHDLRAPIRSIMYHAEEIILGLRRTDNKAAIEPQNLASKLSRIVRSGMQLVHEVDGIMDEVRYEGDVIRIRVANHSVSDFLKQRFIENCKLSCETRNLEFIFNPCTNGKDQIFFDPDKLLKILTNLFSNSLKFTDSGAIKVEIKDGFGHVKIILSDTGVGIPKDKIGKIFDKYSTDDYGVQSRMGTGLGLFMVKEFVQLLRGKITVRSKIGNGTIFTIVFPKSAAGIDPRSITPTAVSDYINSTEVDAQILSDYNKDKDEAMHGLLAENVIDPKKITVLCVDDEPQFLVDYKRELDGMGLNCYVVPNGKIALEKLHEVQPKIIFLDLDMPEMGGMEFLNILRNEDKYADFRSCRVIIATARADKRSEAFEQGTLYYISKPIMRQEIVSIVKQQLEELSKEDHLRSELQKLRTMQSTWIGKQPGSLVISESSEFDIKATHIPCEEMSGDMYGYFIDDNKITVMLVDGCGHGAEPGQMAMLMIRQFFKSISRGSDIIKAIEDISEDLYWQFSDPDKKVPQMRVLDFDSSEGEHKKSSILQTYMTGIAIQVDRQTKNATYVNMGQPNIVLKRDGELTLCRFINSSPIGLFGKNVAVFTPGEFQLHKGDELLLYTDGVTDIFRSDRSARMLGSRGLLKMLGSTTDHDEILGKVQEYQKRSKFEDDVTLVTLIIK